MKLNNLTKEERKIIKDKAFRLYKEAEKIVLENPKNYDQNLVFKLMREEQALLDVLRTDEKMKLLNKIK